MFDSSAEGLGRLTGTELAALIETNHRELVARENQVLQLAAAWADLHDTAPGDNNSPLIARSRITGGDGTPPVSEFAAAEFGTLQGVGMVSAWNQIGAALDLRHRLPRLWVQVQAGQVRAWQATKVAEQTRHLSWAAAADIDHALAGYLGMMPWPRLQKILTAAIIAADPDQAREREHRARTERCVYATQSEHGLKLIIARATAGDVTVFMATINRLADILAARGDTTPIDLRRSKAIGLIAQPARALQLLIDHAGDPGHPADRPEPAGDHDPNEPEPDSEADAGAGAEIGPQTSGDDSEARDEHPPSSSTEPETQRSGLILTPPSRWDPVAARPRVVLHYHLSDAAFLGAPDTCPGDAVVRPDNADPITLNQLSEFLTDTGCQITVRPVIDPADTAAVDAYEIPQRTRDAVRYRNLADVFPYGTCTSATMDLDHTLAYQHDGGPPGQTRADNLGPLSRASHRAATHGRWQKRQPDPGVYLWRSPHGWIYLVTNHGTLNLGRTPYAHAVWQAATDQAHTVIAEQSAA